MTPAAVAEQVEQVPTEARVVVAPVISYTDPEGRVRNASRGDVIEITPDSAAWMERGEIPALAPAGMNLAEATEHDAYLRDVYRAGRGDSDAAARVAAIAASVQPPPRGGIENIDEPGGASVNEYVATIRTQHPSVDETVALAGDDPQRAARVLAAEKIVAEGRPRAGVVKGLDKIIGG